MLMPASPGRFAAVVVAALGLAGCATNPVSSESQLSLISRQQEIQMGRQAAQQARQTPAFSEVQRRRARGRQAGIARRNEAGHVGSVREGTMSRIYVTILGVTLALISAAYGQQSQSVDAAATLTRLLHERKLEAIAVRDPGQPDRFIAALYFPPSQLLVISSVHPVPAALDERLAQQQYRDVYTDLHGSGVHEGRVFVTDLQANGLRRMREPNEPFDIVYRNGVDQASYDADWRAQKLTESQYNERFRKDDAEYARMLNVLADALRAPATERP